MLKQIRDVYSQKPLLAIIIAAFIIRLFAAFFSKGYGMHDDHFGPIQQPYEIMQDYSIWEERGNPHGHSVVYPALHYYLFLSFESAGINDPQDKMLIVRLLHAAFSLLTVFFGYKIIEICFDKELAKLAGWLLALFWLLPFMSVRNLTEMVSVPFLMGGVYFALNKKIRNALFYAGLLFGLAFVFRYQTLLVAVGIGLVLLYEKRIADSIKLILGILLTTFLVQGIADILAWGYPFAALYQYVFSSAGTYQNYPNGPWYQYILLLFGIFIPPMSFLILFAFVKYWKKHLIIVLPLLLFLAFHSFYPNKQERFILPIVPLMLIFGAAAWQNYVNTDKFWQKYKNLNRTFWIWFWTVNTALMLVFIFTYSKKSRIEPLYYLSHKENVNIIMIETGEIGNTFQPTFYLNHNAEILQINKKNSLADVSTELRNKGSLPEYVIFYGKENLTERMKTIEEALSVELIQEYVSDPSLIDSILHSLNPKHNKNEISYVYRVEK